MRFRPSFLVVPFVIAAASLVALGACSNQGEGEVCNHLNGSDDCQDGLVCRQSPNTDIGSSLDYPDRCCPPVGTPSTVPGCAEIFTPATSYDANFGDAPAAPAVDASDAGAASTPDAGDAGAAAPADASGADGSVSDASGDAGAALDAADGAPG